MGLEVYRQKRDFTKTAEPQGAAKPAKGSNAYLIQKHAACRLHYDLRLELDGVLLSWAVTRGPSLVPGEKRLAVHVEDHPLEYGDFEGTIPKGERSEEHTSELQSLMRISYAVFCLKKKNRRQEGA